MKLTQGRRIAFELLGPALLGGAAATLWSWGTLVSHSMHQGESVLVAVSQLLIQMPVMALVYVLFAFPMIGVQAACYTAIMEWRFSRGLSPRSWPAVVLSTFLGYLSGLTLALCYGYESKVTWYLFNFFNLLGLAVGLVLGLLIRRLTPKAPSVTQVSP